MGLIKTGNYDVAFLDVNMPELSGIEISRYVKDNNINTKIVYLTGYPCVNEMLAKELGADEYLRKPVDLKVIGDIVDKELRILIVEDSPLDAELIARELTEGGLDYTSKWVKSKDEFLRALVEHAPAIILCDYNMPDFGAQEALKIKKESFPKIPLIVVSGTIGEDLAVNTIKLGAVDYILKDRLGRLVMAVRRALEETKIASESEQLRTELIQAKEVQLAHFQKAMANSTDAIGMLTPDGRHYYQNEAFTKLFGFSVSETEAALRSPATIYVDEKVGRSIFDTIMRGDAWTGEVKMFTKDKRIVDISLRAYPIKDNNGNILGLVGIHTDITERKRWEIEREKTLKWQLHTNMLRQALLVSGRLEHKLNIITESVVRIFDADFCRIWLIRPGDLCEKGCIHAKNKIRPHVCRFRDKCLHLMSSSGRYTHIDGKNHARVPFGCYKIGLVAAGLEHKFLTNDVVNDPRVHNHEWARELGLMSFAGYQLKVPGGEVIGVLALFAKHPILASEDALLDNLSTTTAFVVQQAAAAEEMVRSKVIQSTSEMKSKFAAMVSHELRSPLGAIKEGINLVEEGLVGNINNKQKNLLDIAKNNLDRLERLINNVLDFQKIEARGMEFDIRENDINEVVSEVASAMGMLADKKKLDFTVNLCGNVPKSAFDKDRVNQVVTNLVNNAIKFTESGNVSISTMVENNTLHVVVQDTGRGIRREDILRLFQPFEQIDNLMDKKKGGSGLGLAISKDIIEAHKGKIWAESEFGKGSVFHFTLPIKERRG